MHPKLRNYDRGLKMMVKDKGCFSTLNHHSNKPKNISLYYFYISYEDLLKLFPGVSFVLLPLTRAFDYITNNTRFNYYRIARKSAGNRIAVCNRFERGYAFCFSSCHLTNFKEISKYTFNFQHR